MLDTKAISKVTKSLLQEFPKRICKMSEKGLVQSQINKPGSLATSITRARRKPNVVTTLVLAFDSQDRSVS